MSALPHDAGAGATAGDGAPDFGLEPAALAELRALFAATPGLARVWVFGSRARGDHRARSDLDLALDAPGWSAADVLRLKERMKALPIVYPLDVVHWQAVGDALFIERIERDRQVLWQPRQGAATRALVAGGGVQLKKFQEDALRQLDAYLAELRARKDEADTAVAAMTQLKAMEHMQEALRTAGDYPRHAWDALRKAGALPAPFAALAHSSRWDGADRAIPNVCLKVPTGGGKTLLAAASVGRVFHGFLRQNRGLVLWVVPNDAIYRQTLRTLKDRDHPYHQMLQVAGAGRVKILEKDDPLTRLDVESHLCVMLLMLAAASRQSRDTLRFFRDRGNVLGFVPREDDIEAHWQLLRAVPNLDVYASAWMSAEDARAQKGSIVKSSLGNVMRLVRPMVVIDEGQHGYTETALATIDGFNPSFLLELSATPRVAGEGGRGAPASGSNILVNVRGTDLDEAQMIKLPIHVDARHWSDWQSCLAESVRQLDLLEREARQLEGESGRYIRPILLVQVERTGKDQVDAGHIHAQHARAYLAQLGFAEASIREKTSEKDEIAGEELLSPASQVRVIITKQALQEGWDCPFAYVLCALAASRGQRAMTQLVGRILRLPHTHKTGRAALDACYVYCHDLATGQVVESIRHSLKGEGMGDLVTSVRAEGPEGASATQTVRLQRREGLQRLRIFVPTVTWVDAGGQRRALQYDSDVLALLPWEQVDVAQLASGWKPGAVGDGDGRGRLVIDLRVLDEGFQPARQALGSGDAALVPRTAIVRALVDLAPNPFLVWHWVDAVLERLLSQWPQGAIAASSAKLIEQLRSDVERERDRLAQQVFDQLVQDGRIEFRLRADRLDYELPHEVQVEVSGAPKKLRRASDDGEMDKSLLVPALRTPDLNEFEALVAGYLDAQPALAWWHRNVARQQYGLQGWKRHKVYPDFVFGLRTERGTARVVLLETKGLHLAGSDDTAYKQALLERLTQAFRDERFRSVGELALEDGEGGRSVVQCDLVLDQAWRATLDSRYFPSEL